MVNRKVTNICSTHYGSFVAGPRTFLKIFTGPWCKKVGNHWSRCTTASSSSLQAEKENERIKQQCSEFCAEDAIESLHYLKERLNNLSLQEDCCSVVYSDSIIFYCFEYNEISLSPKLFVSVIVSDDLSVTAYA